MLYRRNAEGQTLAGSSSPLVWSITCLAAIQATGNALARALLF